MTQIQKKTRRKRKKNHYFTEVHEKAIIQYVATTSIKVKSDLYIAYIQPAFNEMVDKIVYAYKFTSLPNVDILKDDCKIWLVTILDKYDPNKGSKAFSYFSVITKNWFIYNVKKTSKQKRREVDYDSATRELENSQIVVLHAYEKERETTEFWKNFFVEMNSWDTDSLKENEKKVLDAIKILFESSEDIEIFNKKAIYLYLRELTGLNTKQVVSNLKKLRQKYFRFRNKWQNGEI
jgi:hypothetical protein